MVKRVFFLLNLIRSVPAWLAVRFSGAEAIVRRETQGYVWFLEAPEASFFRSFHLLMCRCRPYRSQVIFRCAERSAAWSYVLRLLFPPKQDLEICGEIGEGLVIYHGHAAVLAPHRAGKNLSVYQGVTIGRNPKPGQAICNPILGDNVTVYANAVVAGGITIGDNVSIGAGAVVMKDVPANSVVIGNPCVIRPKDSAGPLS